MNIRKIMRNAARASRPPKQPRPILKSTCKSCQGGACPLPIPSHLQEPRNLEARVQEMLAKNPEMTHEQAELAVLREDAG
jgi:hypothetical protein